MINSIFPIGALENANEDNMNKYSLGIILGFLGAGLNLQALAGQIPEQAPFVFEYNLTGPATIESQIITATGVIKDICVAYDFTGVVRLEASANGGIAYSKIINGVPLVEGFIPGNQLRFKINIEPNSSLKKLVISYTDSSGVKRLYRNLDLENYKYHQEINVTGGSQEVFNYPLHLSINRDDVYFTAADGQTPLYYYLEDKKNCYVLVPQIPREGTKIYMHYGQDSNKISASKYLDGNRVFLFFDDFNDAVLNEEKWEVIPGFKKEYNIKDAALQLKDCLVLSRNFKIQQGILEFKAKVDDNAGVQAIIHLKAGAPQALFPYEQIVYSSNYPGAEHTIAINNIAKLNVSNPIQPFTYYMYRATINSTGILFERYSQNQQEKQAQIKFLDAGNLGEGNIGLKADAAVFNAGSSYFDWVRVRPYVEVEPVAEVIK